MGLCKLAFSPFSFFSLDHYLPRILGCFLHFHYKACSMDRVILALFTHTIEYLEVLKIKKNPEISMLFSLCYRNIIFPHGMLLLLYRLCSVDMKKKRFIHHEVYACARPSGDLTIGGITCPHSKTFRSTSIAVVKCKLAIFLFH